jgi:hypothetical protein
MGGCFLMGTSMGSDILHAPARRKLAVLIGSTAFMQIMDNDDQKAGCKA